MKFIEGLINIVVYSFIMLLVKCLIAKAGASVEFATADTQYLADAIIMAGTLASGKD